MPRLRGRKASFGPAGPASILLISASMGAGHDGAARALAAELQAAGHHAEVRDFLKSGPLRIGSALRRGYEFELKHFPSAYDATYRLWYRLPWLCSVVAWLVNVLTGRKVLRWVREAGAGVVVSTYPLATLCLGRLRAKKRLSVPAINFITDFGVHPLWVHRGVDLNLTVHEAAAQVAAARTEKPSVACGPVVSPSFDPMALPERASAREVLGLRPDQRAILVVAGSWGVGDVQATWNAIVQDGRFTPVVVCGRDQQLHTRVASLARASSQEAVVLGWTDNMPGLMSACDALVENAGGLTSLEAMRAGLPVVSFYPIAGHGKENTARMAAAGVSRLAEDPAGLAEALERLTVPGPERDEQVARAQGMFRLPASELVLDQATRVPSLASDRVSPRRVALVAAKAVAALAAVSALGWAGLTRGVAMATEVGAGVAHPARGSGAVVYMGVRLDAAEVADARVVRALRDMNVTAVVDTSTAMSNPGAVRALAAAGVDVENGGLGEPGAGQSRDSDLLPWNRARRDARASQKLGQIIDMPVTVTIPGRRLTAWDLVECSDVHTSLVVPNHILDVRQLSVEVIHVSSRHIYLVNALTATPGQLLGFLSDLNITLISDDLSSTPLAALA